MDVKFSYFALCSVLCREGLRSTLVHLGGFPKGGGGLNPDSRGHIEAWVSLTPPQEATPERRSP